MTLYFDSNSIFTNHPFMTLSKKYAQPDPGFNPRFGPDIFLHGVFVVFLRGFSMGIRFPPADPKYDVRLPSAQASLAEEICDFNWICLNKRRLMKIKMAKDKLMKDTISINNLDGSCMKSICCFSEQRTLPMFLTKIGLSFINL